MNKLKLIFFSLMWSLLSYAQLTDGTTAPNWTLTDIDSNTHVLYDYVGQGKTVFIIFNATWSAPDWAYHSSNALETLYINNGPTGLDNSMVFFIEADASTNLADLMGTGTATQGDYVTGTSYPIIDSDAINSAYNIAYFPTIYKICPSDTAINELGQLGSTALINEVGLNNCFGPCSNYLLNTSIISNASAGICDGSAQAYIVVGSSPVSYEWSNGETTNIANNLCTGTNWVYVVDALGCSDTVFVTINQLPFDCSTYSFTLNNQTNVSSSLECDASAEVAVIYGTAPYIYEWSNGENTNIATSLCEGVNWITVLDANNCSDTLSFGISSELAGPDGNVNAFSPDGDGVNDVFIMDYPSLATSSNTVTILNRWGAIIASFNNYNNLDVVWDGIGINGNKVVEGTYFYILEIPESNIKETNWIQVVR
jgi:gliding motility-associated-like protein